MALSTRSISLQSNKLSIVTMYDRRTPTWPVVEWLLQCELEPLFYGTGPSTGAFYRLLSRASLSSEGFRSTISLRRMSIDALLITEREWRQLVGMFHHGVRVDLLADEQHE